MFPFILAVVTSLHDTDKYLVRAALEIFDYMFKLGVLTTVNITAADTVDGVRTIFTDAAASAVYGDQETPNFRNAVASLDIMEKLNVIDDAAILGLTTYATFRALFSSLDPTLDSSTALYHGVINPYQNSKISGKTIN